MNKQIEKRPKRPDWYMQTIRRLYQYPEDKKRLVVLESQLQTELPSVTASYSLTPRPSGVSDQTGNIAIRRFETAQEIYECTLRIRAVESILGNQGEDEKKIITFRYFSTHNFDWWVAQELRLPLKTYYRLRDELIARVAVSLGICDKDQLSFAEMGWRA